MLKVECDPCRDGSQICGNGLPLFTDGHDSCEPAHALYPVRFKVKSCVVLDPKHAIPIHKPEVWNCLSFTRGQQPKDPGWKGFLRGNLKRFDDSDGRHLEKLLKKQQRKEVVHQLSRKESRALERARRCGIRP